MPIQQDPAQGEIVTTRGPLDDVVPAPKPPVIRRGDVAFSFLHEMAQLVDEWRKGKEFEAKVVEAAKSPASWLLLRDALTGGGK